MAKVLLEDAFLSLLVAPVVSEPTLNGEVWLSDRVTPAVTTAFCRGLRLRLAYSKVAHAEARGRWFF